MLAARWRRAAPWPIAALAYTALAVALTWPLAPHITSRLPHDAGDPILNTTILWWNATVRPLSSEWWNFPIFWPLHGALAFSEHLLGLSLVATPLQRLGASPVLAYNLLFLASFPLAALALHLLTRALTSRHDAAAVAALTFAFSPYRAGQLAHLQVLWSWGVPLALFALHRFVATRRAGYLALFGVAWLWQSLSNLYFVFFFATLVAAWIVWFLRDDWRGAARVAAVWAGASLPLVPVLAMYQRVHRAFALERLLDEVRGFSADLDSILTTTPEAWIHHHAALGEAQLYPGAIALALPIAAVIAVVWRRRGVSTSSAASLVQRVALGVAVASAAAAGSAWMWGPWRATVFGIHLITIDGFAKPLTTMTAALVAAVCASETCRAAWRTRSTIAFYIAAAVLMYGFALGPQPALHGRTLLHYGPYWLLLQLPGFPGLRVPARFATPMTLCLAVAAGLAFARQRWRSRPAAFAVAAVAVVTMAEAWLPALQAVPAPTTMSALMAPGVPRAPIVELPLGSVLGDVAALGRIPWHHEPVINGYSGYVPRHYTILRIALDMDDTDALNALATEPILVAISRRDDRFDRWCALVSRRGALVADDGAWRVYRVTPPAAPEPIEGDRLAIASVTASAGGARVAQMLDGDITTAWNSERPQSGDEEVVVELGRERFVSGVMMQLGALWFDFPRRLVVDCAGEAGVWSECWRGSSAALAVQATLAPQNDTVLAVPIHRDRVRRVRLRQVGADARNGWSIAELGVVGR